MPFTHTYANAGIVTLKISPQIYSDCPVTRICMAIRIKYRQLLHKNRLCTGVRVYLIFVDRCISNRMWKHKIYTCLKLSN